MPNKRSYRDNISAALQFSRAACSGLIIPDTILGGTVATMT